MFHDIIVLVVVFVVAYVSAEISFVTFRPERFANKMDWWKAEGIMIFFLACVGMALLALGGNFFHSLR